MEEKTHSRAAYRGSKSAVLASDVKPQGKGKAKTCVAALRDDTTTRYI